jgi:O-antigen ligase
MNTGGIHKPTYYAVLKQVNFFSMLLIVSSLPFSVKFNSIFIGLFLVTAILLAFSQEEKISIHWLYCIPILLYCTVILSFFNSYSLSYWLSDMETKTSLVVFPVCFILSKHNLTKKKIEIILLVFATATLLCCLIAHALVLGKMINNGDSLGMSFHWSYSYAELARPMGIDPIYLSLYICFSTFIFLRFLSLNNKIGLKVSIWALVIYLVFFLVLLSSRIGILVFVIVALIQATINLKRKILLPYFVGVVITIGLLILYVEKVPLAKERFYPILSDIRLIFSPDPSKKIFDNRVIIYRCSLSVLFSNISLIGIGAGNDTNAMNECYISQNYGELKNFNAHNDYLTVLIRNGILGFGLFVLLLITPLFINLRINNMLLNVFPLVVIFNSFVECLFSRQKGLVFYTFFYCLLSVYSFLGKQK